ncbi:MAG: thiL [Nevskia sp.]|nr:thiL [Nevskia sp.]
MAEGESVINEFTLIRRYFARVSETADVALGIGDDCALLRPIAGCVAALTTDTLVAGRHFPIETAAHAIGWKALAVNLSDLAAMGAEPQAFLLALTLPEFDASWLEQFADGLHALARDAGIHLIGGDTTRGPLAITITAIGQVPEALALRRSGAQVGDVVCVTGTLGDAALALQLLQTPDSMHPTTDAHRQLRARLDYPTPRLAAGLCLREFATAAIDLSDGLAGDIGHILAASNVGAEIAVQDLPMSPAFAQQHAPSQRLQLQVAGGDDYELCVCIPPQRLREAQAALALALTPIGRITAAPGLRWFDASGHSMTVELSGYDHFKF